MKLLILSLFFLSACAPEDRTHFKSQVVNIGGCDSSGMCGVRLANGTILSDVRQPVMGSYPDCSKKDTCHEVLQ